MGPSFFAELQRRHVYKVGATYAVAGWLLAQVVTQVLPVFNVSMIGQRILVLILIAGFPIALVLAWLFDITPDGLVRTEDLPSSGETPALANERRGTDRKLNYILGSLLLLSLGYVALDHTVLRRVDSGNNAADQMADKSVAVLPFENLSDDKENAYFASGIQDEVLTQLAKIGALKVISRTSTAHYASSPEDLPKIAQELGVANILEGSVQRAGNSVHVNVQLIHAATDAHLWAETYDRKLDNIFGVEGEVASAIAKQLDARLSHSEKAELARRPTQNAVAYEAFLKGQAAEHDEFSRASLEQAVEHYKAAIAADPGFAEAWIAQAAARMAIYLTFAHRPEDQTLIKQQIDEGLRLQPELPEAWRVLGRYQRLIVGDFTAAESTLRHALQLLPNDAGILLALAAVSKRSGHWDEAATQAIHASEVNPRDPQVWSFIADLAQSRRHYRQALEARLRQQELTTDKVSVEADLAGLYLEQGDIGKAAGSLSHIPFDFHDPNIFFGLYPHYWRYTRKYQEGIDTWNRELTDTATHPPEDIVTGIIERGDIYVCANDQDKARADFENARKRLLALRESGVTNYEIPILLGPIDAALGQGEEALAVSRKVLEEVDNNLDYKSWARQQLARVEMMTGDVDAAIGELETSFKEPDGVSVGSLQYDCLWDPLRDKPRFQKLLGEAQSALKADAAAGD